MAGTRTQSPRHPASTGTDLIRATAPARDRYGYPSSDDRLKPEVWVLVVFGLCMLPLAVGTVQALFNGHVGNIIGFGVLFFAPVIFRICHLRDFPVLRIIMGILAGLSCLWGLSQLAGGAADGVGEQIWTGYFVVALPALFVTTEKLHAWWRDDVLRRRFLLFLDTVQLCQGVEVCLVDRVIPSGERPGVLMYDALTGQPSGKKSVWMRGVQPGMVVAVDPDYRVVSWVRQECLVAANRYR